MKMMFFDRLLCDLSGFLFPLWPSLKYKCSLWRYAVPVVCILTGFEKTLLVDTVRIGENIFFLKTVSDSIKCPLFSGFLADTPVCDWLWVWRRSNLQNAMSRYLRFVLHQHSKSPQICRNMWMSSDSKKAKIWEKISAHLKFFWLFLLSLMMIYPKNNIHLPKNGLLILLSNISANKPLNLALHIF